MVFASESRDSRRVKQIPKFDLHDDLTDEASGMDISASCHDADSKSSVDSSRYERWGGLPAAAAACDSFETDRVTDAGLKAMFATLDALEARCKGCQDFDRIAAAMVESKLTAEEVSRMNSPLLDGLWKLVSCLEPDGSSELVVDRPAPLRVVWCMLTRLLSPRPYRSTVEFLDLLNADVIDTKLDRMELCRLLDLAAFSGDASLVHLLIQRGALIGVEAAECSWAA